MVKLCTIFIYYLSYSLFSTHYLIIDDKEISKKKKQRNESKQFREWGFLKRKKRIC